MSSQVFPPVSDSSLLFLQIAYYRALSTRCASGELSEEEARERLERVGYDVGWRYIELCSGTRDVGRLESTIDCVRFVFKILWNDFFRRGKEEIKLTTDGTRALGGRSAGCGRRCCAQCAPPRLRRRIAS